MKPQLFAQMLTVSAIALGGFATISQPSSAQTTTYFCGTSNNGAPTTYAKTVTGKKIPVIRWVSAIGGLTPKIRCQQVSARFESAYEKGVLNYITTGIIKGQQVVCAASEYGGRCSHLLFTLKEGENASVVIQNLFDIGYRARGPIVQSRDGSRQIYIDMNRLLRQAPPEAEN